MNPTARSLSMLTLAALVLGAGSVARCGVTIEQRKADLVITGDAAANSIVVRGTTSMSELEVAIDGVLPTRIFAGVRNLTVETGAGDDRVGLVGFHLGGNVSIRLGAGVDRAFVGTHKSVALRNDLFIGGRLDIRAGGSAGDVIEIQPDPGDSLTFGGDVRVDGARIINLNGDGGEDTMQDGDLLIGGDLSITTDFDPADGVTASHCEIDDVNVGGKTTIDLGASADVVVIGDSHFTRNVSIDLGPGDDELDLDDGPSSRNRFDAKFVAKGGAGTDALDIRPENLFAVAPTVRAFESDP